MAKIEPSEAGIEALKNFSSLLRDTAGTMYDETKRVQTEVEQYQSKLGPHAASLRSSLDTIQTEINKCIEPTQSLADSLDEMAKDYQEFLDDDPFAGIGDGGNSSSGGDVISGMGTAAATAAGVGIAAGGTSSTSSGGATGGGLKQESHRSLISDREAALDAVMKDVMDGSGKSITREQAEKYYDSVQTFSGDDMSGNKNDYHGIREAYNNPDADPEYVEKMNNLDEYLKGAPKWEGQVYRGINVDKKTADSILSKSQVDMLGPASWSSDEMVANQFSHGTESVRMVFVLPENKSGASVTHIASYNGAESEVTAPSGVLYDIDMTENVNKDGYDYIYVYVHE